MHIIAYVSCIFDARSGKSRSYWKGVRECVEFCMYVTLGKHIDEFTHVHIPPLLIWKAALDLSRLDLPTCPPRRSLKRLMSLIGFLNHANTRHWTCPNELCDPYTGCPSSLPGNPLLRMPILVEQHKWKGARAAASWPHLRVYLQQEPMALAIK